MTEAHSLQWTLHGPYGTEGYTRAGYARVQLVILTFLTSAASPNPISIMPSKVGPSPPSPAPIRLLLLGLPLLLLDDELLAEVRRRVPETAPFCVVTTVPGMGKFAEAGKPECELLSSSLLSNMLISFFCLFCLLLASFLAGRDGDDEVEDFADLVALGGFCVEC